jgi:hypothetical protein
MLWGEPVSQPPAPERDLLVIARAYSKMTKTASGTCLLGSFAPYARESRWLRSFYTDN